MVIRDLPVANSLPTGQEKVTTEPYAVSLLEASAPAPGRNGGQSVKNKNNYAVNFLAISIKLQLHIISYQSGVQTFVFTRKY